MVGYSADDYLRLNSDFNKRDEIAVRAQRVRAAHDKPVLQVDHAHALDSERVARAGHVDAGPSVDVAVLRIGVGAAVVHEVQAVDVESGELDRADARVAVPFHEERGPGPAVRVWPGGQVDHDAAASGPDLVQVGPALLVRVVADAGGHEPVPVSLDAQVADVDEDLGGEPPVPGRDVDRGSGLAETGRGVGIGLTLFDVPDDRVDDLADVLAWIALRPIGHIVIVLRRHDVPFIVVEITAVSAGCSFGFVDQPLTAPASMPETR